MSVPIADRRAMYVNRAIRSFGSTGKEIGVRVIVKSPMIPHSTSSSAERKSQFDDEVHRVFFCNTELGEFNSEEMRFRHVLRDDGTASKGAEQLAAPLE